MPLFLDTRGQPTLGIALCARCGMKAMLGQLVADPNFGGMPNMMVHPECRDDYDPYRLAPRQPDNITLPFTRPDLPLVTVELVDDFAFMDGEMFTFMDGEQFEFME